MGSRSSSRRATPGQRAEPPALDTSALAPLGPETFAGPVEDVARSLLGAILVRRLPSGPTLKARIVEVEAYGGLEDQASHARRGRTARASLMFGPPGLIYVYLIYGLHHCLNVVTGPDGLASAVLIRALEAMDGVEGPCDGPGKLCRTLSIDRSLNGLPLNPSSGLWLATGGASSRPVGASARIGIDSVPEPWRRRPWRFFLADSRSLSRRT